jgi:hypothetical protein
MIKSSCVVALVEKFKREEYDRERVLDVRLFEITCRQS